MLSSFGSSIDDERSQKSYLQSTRPTSVSLSWDSTWINEKLSLLENCARNPENTQVTECQDDTRGKSGYQIYHQQRVAYIRETTGVSHREAFRQAAKDWSNLSFEEQSVYIEQAGRKRKIDCGFRDDANFQELFLEWKCASCGKGDAGAPNGTCLMCTAFGGLFQ